MKTGIELIAEARARQIAKHGWTADHDDTHTDGSLRVEAARCAVDGTDAAVVDSLDRDWGIVARHGHAGTNPDIVHLLAIAGALIAAEIERVQRRDSARTALRSPPDGGGSKQLLPSDGADTGRK